MEVWIVGGLCLVAFFVLIISLIKGRRTKDKRWFFLAKIMGGYIAGCIGYFVLSILVKSIES